MSDSILKTATSQMLKIAEQIKLGGGERGIGGRPFKSPFRLRWDAAARSRTEQRGPGGYEAVLVAAGGSGGSAGLLVAFGSFRTSGNSCWQLANLAPVRGKTGTGRSTMPSVRATEGTPPHTRASLPR